MGGLGVRHVPLAADRMSPLRSWAMMFLAMLARNDLSAPLQDNRSIILYTRPTRLQDTAFERLGIDPRRVQ
jgi:hypothetical protein